MLNSKLLVDLLEKAEMQLRKVMYHPNSYFQLLKITETSGAVNGKSRLLPTNQRLLQDKFLTCTSVPLS